MFDNVALHVFPGSLDEKCRAFIGFLIIDYDSGGFQEEICEPGIRLSVLDKIGKTIPKADRFDHWALVLVDHVWLSDMEPMKLSGLNLGHFDSIVIINCTNRVRSSTIDCSFQGIGN